MSHETDEWRRNELFYKTQTQRTKIEFRNLILCSVSNQNKSKCNNLSQHSQVSKHSSLPITWKQSNSLYIHNAKAEQVAVFETASGRMQSVHWNHEEKKTSLLILYTKISESKNKIVPEQVLKVKRKGKYGGTDSNLGARWIWEVSFTPFEQEPGAPQFAWMLLRREEHHVLHGNEPQYPCSENQQDAPFTFNLFQ
jgi:hypothetical protein